MTQERHEEIRRILGLRGEVSVEDLAARLSVTASTIRRDLGRLAELGTVTRTYGGAVLAAPGPAEQALPERMRMAAAEKDAIGRWAADQVRDGGSVILDAGTTVGRLAHHLRHRSGVRVITNGLSSVLGLADAAGLEVVCLGGELRPLSQGYFGPLTELTLGRLTAQQAFLGADGIVADRGLNEATLAQTRVKELMTARARQVFVLADSSKIGAAPFDAWAPLDREYTLVTDTGATREQLAPFRATPGVHVVTVPA